MRPSSQHRRSISNSIIIIIVSSSIIIVTKSFTTTKKKCVLMSMRTTILWGIFFNQPDTHADSLTKQTEKKTAAAVNTVETSVSVCTCESVVLLYKHKPKRRLYESQNVVVLCVGLTVSALCSIILSIICGMLSIHVLCSDTGEQCFNLCTQFFFFRTVQLMERQLFGGP